MKKSVLGILKENVCCDMVSRDKASNYVFRRSYFYRIGSPVSFCESIKSELKTLGLNAELIDFGDHWAPFKGRQTIKSGSHFYATFNIKV